MKVGNWVPSLGGGADRYYSDEAGNRMQLAARVDTAGGWAVWNEGEYEPCESGNVAVDHVDGILRRMGKV